MHTFLLLFSNLHKSIYFKIIDKTDKTINKLLGDHGEVGDYGRNMNH